MRSIFSIFLGSRLLNLLPQERQLSLDNNISEEQERFAKTHFISDEASTDRSRVSHLPIDTECLVLVNRGLETCDDHALVDLKQLTV